METKTRVHFAPTYFRNPLHRIKIDLIGAGGNGSQMLSALSRIDHALRALGGKGLYVTAWDPDTVEQPNIGRQLFSPSELGLNKAQALITRFNRFYGIDWEAKPRRYDTRVLDNGYCPNVIISCVDNIDSRLEIAGKLKKNDRFNKYVRYTQFDEHRLFYWMDLGNGQDIGQVILGSADIKQPENTAYECVGKLPLVTEELKLDRRKERNKEPSCSMAEALRKQDLFVNSALVQMAGSILWHLLKEGYTQIRGCYLNLEQLICAPIEV